jgi:protein-tyrosine phosphatase
MRNLYTSMMFGNPAVHALVERFVGGCSPLYFHCTAGKDRTGVCAAVLLMLLDVSDDAIVHDFLLTNQYRACIINMPPEQLPAWLPERERENWGKMNGVNEEDLRASLAAVVERHGSREAYAKAEFGLDAAALSRLRDRYLA